MIHLADGQTLQAQESGSSWRYVGFGHVFGFGGGDFRAELEFSRGGNDWVWKGNSIPIVLQFDGAHPVLVTFDRETNFAKTTFRYFRHESDWRELPLTLFPKNLAIQNMWIGNVAQILQKADFEDYLYRSSLQSLLRHCIVNGTQYWEMNGREADRKFLEDYEKQYLGRE